MALVDMLYLSLPGLLIALKLGFTAFAIGYIARHASGFTPLRIPVAARRMPARRTPPSV